MIKIHSEIIFLMSLTSKFINIFISSSKKYIFLKMFKYFDFRGQIFSQTIELPTDVNVDFRYFIAVVCQLNEVKNPAQTLIIRKWETHMTPRLIKKDS